MFTGCTLGLLADPGGQVPKLAGLFLFPCPACTSLAGGVSILQTCSLSICCGLCFFQPLSWSAASPRPSGPHGLSLCPYLSLLPSVPVCSPQPLSLFLGGSFSPCSVCLSYSSTIPFPEWLQEAGKAYHLLHPPPPRAVFQLLPPTSCVDLSTDLQVLLKEQGWRCHKAPFPLDTPQPLTTQLLTPHFQNEVSCGLLACCGPLMIYSPALCTSLCPREPDPTPCLPSELVTLSSI